MDNTKQAITFKELTNGEISIDTPVVEKEDGISTLKKGDMLTVSSELWFDADTGIGYARMENEKYVLMDNEQFDRILKNFAYYEKEISQLQFDNTKYANKLKKSKKFTYSKKAAQQNQIYILSDALEGKRNIEIHRTRGFSTQSIARVLAVSPKPGMTEIEVKECKAKDLARLRKIYDRDNRSIIFGPFDLVEEWYDHKVEQIMSRQR